MLSSLTCSIVTGTKTGEAERGSAEQRRKWIVVLRRGHCCAVVRVVLLSVLLLALSSLRFTELPGKIKQVGQGYYQKPHYSSNNYEV